MKIFFIILKKISAQDVAYSRRPGNCGNMKGDENNTKRNFHREVMPFFACSRIHKNFTGSCCAV